MANTTKATTRSKTTPASKPPRAAAPATKPRTRTTRTPKITPEMRQKMIAEAAYLRAEQRGFGSGDPTEDWLAAEREVDTLLSEGAARTAQ